MTNKKAEEALHPKEAELQRVADPTPIVLARLSRDLRYVFVNAALADMFGLPAEEIVGRPIAEIMGRDAFETIRPYVERILSGEKVEYEAEIPYQGIGTRVKQVTCVPERNETGEVTGWISSVVDITQRKHAEEVLRLFLMNTSMSCCPTSRCLKWMALSFCAGCVSCQGSELPVLALTGFGRPEVIERAQAEGFFCHLTKPVELERLISVLQKVSTKVR